MVNKALISGRLVPEKPASSAQGASMARSVKISRKRKLNRSSFFADFRFVQLHPAPPQGVGLSRAGRPRPLC